MKRVLALVLLLPLVHLNVARADVACGKHQTSDAATDAKADAHAAHTGHGAQHDAPASDASCDGPAQSDCWSCGLAAWRIDPSFTIALADMPAGQRYAAPRFEPLSTTAAPEPPPPRA